MGEQDSADGNKIAQVEQVVAAALRPLPTQTGDGSYIQAPTVTGLAKDLLHFDLKDAKTLAEVAKSAITGEAVNDRDYIMERVIQVGQSKTN
jgi:linoleate 8R-lipoxygenase/9,12-octadecadienoate 8-hydroperoxide 8R-isomerase